MYYRILDEPEYYVPVTSFTLSSSYGEFTYFGIVVLVATQSQ